MFEFNLNLCLLPKPTNFTISLSSLYRPALVISCCTWRMWISGQFLHTLWPRLVTCSSYRHGGRRGTVPVFFLRKTLERLNGTVVVQTKEAVKVLSKSFKSFTQLEYASIFFFFFSFFIHSCSVSTLYRLPCGGIRNLSQEHWARWGYTMHVTTAGHHADTHIHLGAI